MTKKQAIILIVLYSILAIIVYFGCLDEYLDYLEVKKTKSPESFQAFYKSHPSGFYIDDVKFLEIQHTKDYALVKNFFRDFPKSDYLAEVKLIHFELWQSLIENYKKKYRDIPNNRGIQFFGKILDYMKDNFQDKIYVKISYDINLKNWEEYDDIAQSFAESGIYESNNRRVLGNILDLKSEMDKINLEYLSSIIYDSLSISFNKNFDSKYIDLQKISEDNDSLIVLNINCKIKNQEIRDSYLVYPKIWIHTKEDENTHIKVFQNYLLGINIDYFVSIKIPNSDDNFIETMHSNPSDYLEYRSPNVSPYAIMVKSTFENYSKKITNLFGL